MKQVIFTRAAQRTLERIPTNTARLIRSKIEQYAADPASLANNVKALKGRGEFLRMRVGDWRVVFGESKSTVDVVDIGPRGGIYD